MARIKVSVFQKTGRKGFHFIWKDPGTGKRKTKASGETKRRDAYRAAVEFEDELNQKSQPDSMTWDAFVSEYERHHLNHLSRGAAYQTYSAFKRFRSAVNVVRLEQVPDLMKEFRLALLTSNLASATQTGYLKHFRAAMNWAHQQGLLTEKLTIKMPPSPETEMKGRPLTEAEYKSMLLKAKELYDESVADFISGLWFSGLRRGEAMILSWDRDAAFSVDRTGQYWRFRIRLGAQKAKRAQLAPMTPDFAQFLEKRLEQTGPIFNPLNTHRVRYTDDGIGKAVAAIGEAAGIVTDQRAERFATCHDFRRSFGDRWARKLMPADLKELMRHRSIETTMKYYVGRNVDDISARLHQLDGANSAN